MENYHYASSGQYVSPGWQGEETDSSSYTHTRQQLGQSQAIQSQGQGFTAHDSTDNSYGYAGYAPTGISLADRYDHHTNYMNMIDLPQEDVQEVNETHAVSNEILPSDNDYGLSEMDLLTVDLRQFTPGSLPRKIMEWIDGRPIPVTVDRTTGQETHFTYIDMCPGPRHRGMMDGLNKPRNNDWVRKTGVPWLSSRCALEKTCREAIRTKMPSLDALINRGHQQDWRRTVESERA